MTEVPVPLRIAVLAMLAALAALATLFIGVLASPLFAVALPVGALGGVLLLSEPFLGLMALVFFGHLDAIEKLLFGFLPLSAFKLITVATLAAVVVTGARTRTGLIYTLREPAAVFGILFCGLFAVSALFAVDRGLAIDALQKTASLLALFLLTVALVDTRRKLEILIAILVVTSLLSALILIADTVLGVKLVAQSEAATTARTSEGFSRSSGASDYNPTTAASMLLVGVVVALTHALESPRHRLLLLGVTAIGGIAVVFSFARSSALAFAFILVALAFRHRRERAFPFAVSVAVLAGLMALPFVPVEYWDRIGSIFGGGSDWTLGRRLSYNIMGLDLLATHPFFGIGPGNFPAHFTDQDFRYMPGRTLIGRELHNMYLSVLVQGGLVGGLAFGGMIVCAFGRVLAVVRAPASERMRVYGICLAYGYAAYLIASLFLPNEYTKYTWIISAICVATWRVNEIERKAAA
jgi:O-antigen ligase